MLARVYTLQIHIYLTFQYLKKDNNSQIIFFKRELNTKTSPLIIFLIVGKELVAISGTLKALYSLIKQPTACQVIIRNFLFLQDITYKVPNTKLFNM